MLPISTAVLQYSTTSVLLHSIQSFCTRVRAYSAIPCALPLSAARLKYLTDSRSSILIPSPSLNMTPYLIIDSMSPLSANLLTSLIERDLDEILDFDFFLVVVIFLFFLRPVLVDIEAG